MENSARVFFQKYNTFYANVTEVTITVTVSSQKFTLITHSQSKQAPLEYSVQRISLLMMDQNKIQSHGAFSSSSLRKVMLFR